MLAPAHSICAKEALIPRVSVIIPTYNRSAFVSEAIDSVLQQSFQDFELIVVDDGSTDGTNEVVARYQADSRVRYIYQPNRGGGAARNTGIKGSAGRYIALLDSDDLWLSGKLELQVNALDANPDVAFVVGGMVATKLDKHRNICARSYEHYVPGCSPPIFESIFGPEIFGFPSCVLVRAECFKTVGLFDENVWCSDSDMRRRLALKYKFMTLDVPLATVRWHPGSMTADVDASVRGAVRYLAKLQTLLPASSLRTYHLYLMGSWAKQCLLSQRYLKTVSIFFTILRMAARHPWALLNALSLYKQQQAAKKR